MKKYMLKAFPRNGINRGYIVLDEKEVRCIFDFDSLGVNYHEKQAAFMVTVGHEWVDIPDEIFEDIISKNFTHKIKLVEETECE